MSTYYAALSVMLTALCEGIADPTNGIDPVCTCAPMPGQGYAEDFINTRGCGPKDGLAFVQFVNSFPSASFPNPDQRPTMCETTEFALRFRMGIVRSMPIPAQGRPPDAATFVAVTERQLNDAQFLARIIVCTYPGLVVPMTYQPTGPQGGAVGGYWEYIVEDNP